MNFGDTIIIGKLGSSKIKNILLMKNTGTLFSFEYLTPWGLNNMASNEIKKLGYKTSIVNDSIGDIFTINKNYIFLEYDSIGNHKIAILIGQPQKCEKGRGIFQITWLIEYYIIIQVQEDIHKQWIKIDFQIKARQKRKSVDCCWTPINDFDATEYKEMKKDIDKITDSLIKILKK